MTTLEDAPKYMPRDPMPEDPFKYGYGQSKDTNYLLLSPQIYNIEALMLQGRHFEEKPGTRHVKSLRRWVQKHVHAVEGAPSGEVLITQTYASDDGFSTKQLLALKDVAAVQSMAREIAAQETGMTITQLRPACSVKQKHVSARYVLALDVEAAGVDEIRRIAGFLADLYLDLMRALPIFAQCYADIDPDYAPRCLSGDARTHWSVTAEDRRTKTLITEFCSSEQDAHERITLMRAYKYRFRSLEIDSPGGADRRFKTLMKRVYGGSSSASQTWPFPKG